MSRSAAVTGATGFIGWHLTTELRDRGWKVRAIVRPTSDRAVPEGVERVSAALHAKDLVEACDGVDVIFHLAAKLHGRSRQALDAVNVEGTRQVMTAASAVGARLVHVSSLAALGPSTPARPCQEDDEPRPVNWYGESKLAAEQLLRQSPAWWTILRPAVVYGPRDRQFLPLFRLAKLGLFLRPPRPEAAYNVVHVNDVVRAILAAAGADRARHQLLFVGGAEHPTGDEILQAIAHAVGSVYRPISFPNAIVRAAAWAGDVTFGWGAPRSFDSERLKELLAEGFACRIDRARDIIGFAPSVTLAEGFAALADWYRQERWTS